MYRILVKPNPEAVVIRPVGLPAGQYRSGNGEVLDAGDLMQIGVIPRFPHGDFASCVMIFERC